jgi:hypothetical protein
VELEVRLFRVALPVLVIRWGRILARRVLLRFILAPQVLQQMRLALPVLLHSPLALPVILHLPLARVVLRQKPLARQAVLLAHNCTTGSGT